MKRLMLVAGGNWQCSIARKAKEMGYHVICSSLYSDSPAFRWADACEVADVLDYEKNLAIAEKHHPDAIITDQSDIAVRTVAKLNQKLGLPGIGVDMANLFSNKFLMREFCRENGFPSPSFRLCDQLDEAVECFRVYGKSGYTFRKLLALWANGFTAFLSSRCGLPRSAVSCAPFWGSSGESGASSTSCSIRMSRWDTAPSWRRSSLSAAC